MNIPEKLRKMKPYDPTEDIYRIKLDANESPLEPGSIISQEIACALLNVPFNRYPDPKSERVCSLGADFFGVKRENVVAGNGSDELISVILGSMCQKGGRLMLLGPDFSMYAIYAGLCELEVKVALKDARMEISVDRIIEEAKEFRPDAVLFSNPCNPTGQGIGKAEMLRLCSSLDCLLIIDEAYMDFYGESVLPEGCGYKNVIVLRTASKAFGFAAVRLGFAVGDAELISQLNKARSPFNVNALTQAAAGVFLSHPKYLKECTEEVIRLKNELEDGLAALCESHPDRIGLQRTVTNFAVLLTDSAKELYGKLLERGVCVRCFDDFLRITAGTKRENEALFKALEEILK